jgi:hypothetical protein
VTVAVGRLCFALLYGLVTRAIHGGVSLCFRRRKPRELTLLAVFALWGLSLRNKVEFGLITCKALELSILLLVVLLLLLTPRYRSRCELISISYSNEIAGRDGHRAALAFGFITCI